MGSVRKIFILGVILLGLPVLQTEAKGSGGTGSTQNKIWYNGICLTVPEGSQNTSTNSKIFKSDLYFCTGKHAGTFELDFTAVQNFMGDVVGRFNFNDGSTLVKTSPFEDVPPLDLGMIPMGNDQMMGIINTNTPVEGTGVYANLDTMQSCSKNILEIVFNPEINAPEIHPKSCSPCVWQVYTAAE